MDTPNKSEKTKVLKPFFSSIKRGVHFLYIKFFMPIAQDEDRERQEFILNVILASTIVLFVLLNILIFADHILRGSRYNGVAQIYYLIALFVFLKLYLLSRRGHFLLASYLLIGIYFAMVFEGALHWGVDLPALLLSYTLIIVMASILISTTFGWIAALAVSIMITLVGYLQTEHIAGINSAWRNETFRIYDVFGYLLLLIFIVVISWLSNREIERSLLRARRSEAELKKQRDDLEIIVDERTREIRQIQMERISNIYRMAEFGKMSSGFFHDIVNHLTSVSLYMGELRDKSSGRADDLKAYSEKAYENSKRMESFILAIRKQIQNQEVNMIFNIRDVIKEIIEVLNYKSKINKVEINFIYSKASEIFGNPLRLHQAIINLLSNAVDAYEGMPDDAQKKREVLIDLSEHQEQIKITVGDNASGIAKENLNKIFEPFFTTKPMEKGTGIGLSTTKHIIEHDFKGTIAVQSQLGLGTTFIILLPKNA